MTPHSAGDHEKLCGEYIIEGQVRNTAHIITFYFHSLFSRGRGLHWRRVHVHGYRIERIESWLHMD